VEGTRSALIVANSEYADPGLRRLRAPASDARALESVLHDPGIGSFDVRTLLNAPAYEASLAIEEFLADRQPDDLLLLHFSCHGVKDEDGELYFAMANTTLRHLAATAVAADFVNKRMARSRSRRVVLLLDCCYAGAFERGMTARAGGGVGIETQFSNGRGRAVITASTAMEYAFEAGELTDANELAPSVFTSALVSGLETGEADRDQDGLVGLDELYDYVYEKVRAATPNQTPGKWTYGVQGELVIARRSRPVTTPARLPRGLQEALDNPLAGIRVGAAQELGRLLHGRNEGLALAARLALEELTGDDSRAVAAAAAAALGVGERPADSPRLEVSTTSVNFGQLTQHSRSPEHTIRLSNRGGGLLNARAVTGAKWIRLRQVGDELYVAVGTAALGDRQGEVSVYSDGGSASILVNARIVSAPQFGTDISRPVDVAPVVGAATQPHPQQGAGSVEDQPAPDNPSPIAQKVPAPEGTVCGKEHAGEDGHALLPAQASQLSDRRNSAYTDASTVQIHDKANEPSSPGAGPREEPPRSIGVAQRVGSQLPSASGALALVAGVLMIVTYLLPSPHTTANYTNYILSTCLILLGLAMIRPNRWRWFAAAMFVGIAFSLVFAAVNGVASPGVWTWGYSAVNDLFIASVGLLVIGVVTVLLVRPPMASTGFAELSTRLIFTGALVALVVFGPYNNVFPNQTGYTSVFAKSWLGWASLALLGLFLCVYAIEYASRQSRRAPAISWATLAVATALGLVVVVLAIYSPHAFHVYWPQPKQRYIGVFVPVAATLSILYVGFVAQLSPSRYGAAMIAAWALGTALQGPSDYAVLPVLAIAALGMGWVAARPFDLDRRHPIGAVTE
jgi:Caspase domain